MKIRTRQFATFYNVRMPFIRALACVLAAVPCLLQAQTPARPPYLDQRFDENWNFLRDPARRTDPIRTFVVLMAAAFWASSILFRDARSFWR